MPNTAIEEILVLGLLLERIFTDGPLSIEYVVNQKGTARLVVLEQKGLIDNAKDGYVLRWLVKR